VGRVNQVGIGELPDYHRALERKAGRTKWQSQAEVLVDNDVAAGERGGNGVAAIHAGGHADVIDGAECFFAVSATLLRSGQPDCTLQR
jgi:hypothetical protein